MPHPAVLLAVLGVALVVGFLLLRFNARWVYRWFDHALVRDRKDLPGEYERPRYFKLNQRGELDTSVRWPGWDGWLALSVVWGFIRTSPCCHLSG